MGSTGDSPPLRVFFIPYFAPGHMIPMVDIALLFAARGVDSTIVVTPANAALIRRTIDRAASSGVPVRTLLYPFPSSEVGLPPGCENLGAVPLSDAAKIDDACPLIRPSIDQILRHHRPDAVVSDTHFTFTTSIARDLGVPRFTFHAIGVFPVCVMSSLFTNLPHLSVSDDVTPFLVPNLPDPIHMVRPELPDFLRFPTYVTGAMGDLREAESGSYGVIVNSFAEIESAYADYYLKNDRMRACFVGPVALAYGDEQDRASRGGADENPNNGKCLSWLETKRAGSVVYVCFGSWCHFSEEQLRELATGLEASGHPFMWVVRDDGGKELTWLPEGFEERVEGKGLIVRGWAPQVVILNHVAVGGFVTHCGWNSVLEGVSAGLPVVTWPLSTEQFINEKLLVEVLKTGVRMWEGFRSTVEEEKVVVKGEDIGKAVGRIMGGAGEEVEGMRKRAKEYGEKARLAVKEGGSSYNSLSRLIEEIRTYPQKDGCKDA